MNPNIHTKHKQEAGPASAVALTWDQRESGHSWQQFTLTQHHQVKLISQEEERRSLREHRRERKQEEALCCRTFTLKEFCFLPAKHISSLHRTQGDRVTGSNLHVKMTRMVRSSRSTAFSHLSDTRATTGGMRISAGT